jgi:hypothetical protein
MAGRGNCGSEGDHAEPGQGPDRLHRAACAACTSGAYRVIAWWTNAAVVERAAGRAAAHPEKIAERKAIVEPVFGTLRQWGHDTFLLRGLAKVRAEFSLSALVYNRRRGLNLVSVADRLRALGVAVNHAEPSPA